MSDAEKIMAMLGRIESLLMERGAPADVQQAIEDVFTTYGQVAQMREVIQQLVEIVRLHDAESAHEREQIRSLLMQLRELARKQVAGLADVERAVAGANEQWSGVERRRGDRRRAS